MISTDLLRIRRLATWFAGTTAAIATLIMAGWLFRISPLVRLVPSDPPVAFGTAIGLLGAAGGLWGVARGQPGLIFGGGAVAFVVGALSLVGYLTGTNLEIDRLIVGDAAWLDGAASSSPRTAGASVLSLLLIGTAYFALCLQRLNRLASMLAGTLATIVIGLSITTLLSYATGALSESTNLAPGTGIGIYAAVAFALVGVAVVVHSWRADAAAASEHRFRTVFESGLHFRVLLDVDGTVLEANRTALEYVRAEVDQVRGRKLWETPWWLGSERVERLRAALSKAALGEAVHLEEEIPAGGDQVALVDFALEPIRDDEGKVVQILAEGRDVTERRRTEDTIRELATLSTMGRLAAKVAHDINNPLAGIQNAFLLLKDAVPETHPHHRFVGAIEREIGRIGAITRQLYDTYRPDSDDTQGASVPTIITDAATLLEQVNRNKGVTLAIDTAASPAVLGIPSGLLRQAVYHLVQNAIDRSPPGGQVAVRAWQQEKTFYLTVRHQGPGVPDDIQERIFDPFGGGMGLGLSLVRRSVEAAGGRVRAKNFEEGGSEFTIQIPVGERAGAGQPRG